MPTVSNNARGTDRDTARGLTPAQADGFACVVCGAQSTAMVPVGVLPGVGQVFACATECASAAAGRWSR
ncbi:hypothetical protein [Micromonospora sp. NPDC048830]|uniref:hypothetical protein n=1 Tax=Micromonospora sp. NPDC048830 TaxID=3364257 RepID=UPI0037113C77